MSNKVVLITGALTGIGRATALAFANEGAHVVISGRGDEEGGQEGSGGDEEGGQEDRCSHQEAREAALSVVTKKQRPGGVLRASRLRIELKISRRRAWSGR